MIRKVIQFTGEHLPRFEFVYEYLDKHGVGQYPKEYNRNIHGRFDPARYYGKRDIPFGEVKIAELGEWFSRRNKTPRAAIQAMSRAYWGWQHAYWLPKKASPAGIYQLLFVSCTVFYVLNYSKKKYHASFRYH